MRTHPGHFLHRSKCLITMAEPQQGLPQDDETLQSQVVNVRPPCKVRLRAQKASHDVACGTVIVLKDVGVDAQGDGGVGMAKPT